MSYKTIAVYLARPESVPAVMDAALPLAEAFGAHLTGVHVALGLPVQGTIAAQVSTDIVNEYIQFMREDAREIAANFDKAVRGAKIQTEWRSEEKTAPGDDRLRAILDQVRCADLVVMGQTDAEHRTGDLAADMVLGAGRPVLVVPAKGSSGADFERVAVGWDGSREAARAAFDALPLLERATAVQVVTVGKGDDIKDAVRQGGGELALALARHGVNAEMAKVDRGDSSAGEALLAFVQQQGCDLLVMGCYGHARLRERLFGGASRHVLENMTVPVLMSH